MSQAVKTDGPTRRRWPWRLIVAASILTGTLILLLLVSNVFVLVSEAGKAGSDPIEAPHAEAAIVPGALVKPDGQMSMMLADRVEQASRLYKDGKVEKLLVSGDHGQWTYDEPTVMKNQLLRDGVPARDVFMDHAGFNTWATMERARNVFGVKNALVVTQSFHMPRALYLADAAGIGAHGVTSDLHSYGREGVKSQLRELASRPKAVLDAIRDAGTVGGSPVPITGDGQSSWGPKPPGSR